MEVIPGYRKTEVGVIPQEWDVPRVGDVCGCIVAGRNKPKLFDGDIPWITTPDLEDGKPVATSRHGLCISRAEAKSVGSRVVPAGSVLMSCAGELGIVALTQNEIVVNQQLHAFLPTARIDSSFLLNALAYQKSQITGLGTKTAVPYLNKSNCNSILIPLPSIPEQRAIAEALSDVDALQGALDRLIAKKRDLKRAAMQQLIPGETRLPGFYGEWEVRRFGDIAVPRRDRVDPRTTSTQEFCVELEHIESGSGELLGFTSAGVQASLKSTFCAGDVLFGKLRAYLRKYWLATRPGVCSTEIWVLAPKDRLVTSEFLFQTIKMDEFVEVASNSYGTHMPRSDWNLVKNYELKVPSRPEQTAIAAVLTDMDAELALLEQRMAKTRALKQGMMQELLTGRTRLV